jgi:broad specificity phosphatase PhoE
VKCRGLPRPEPVGQTSPVLSRLLILLMLAAASAGLMSHPAGAAPDTTTTTVVLVRHAEKDTNFVGADQPLNAAGMLRARELSRTLGDVKFSAIYVTPWVRSRKTAEPLAQREGDSLVVIMDAVDGTVRGIRQHPGANVLVVGHSNTVPQIMAALTGQPDLAKLVVGYDDLFVLTLTHGAEPRLLRLHYGAPSAFVR